MLSTMKAETYELAKEEKPLIFNGSSYSQHQVSVVLGVVASVRPRHFTQDFLRMTDKENTYDIMSTVGTEYSALSWGIFSLRPLASSPSVTYE